MENLCHEGFNKTIIKSSDDTKKTSTMEVLNPGYENVNKDKAETSNKKEEKKSKEKEETSNADADDDSDDEQHIKTKEARQFAEINDLGKSFEYMRLHPWLASSDISDEIMAEAFTLELNGDSSKVVQYIRQSKILQYCSELDPRARAVFEDDVAKTHEHIKNRCVVLRKEHEEREARRKELLSKQDPNEAIEIAIPETASENERARAVAFQTFPPPFQHALLSGDLEKVNEVLQTLESDEAERILELCNETGLLSIEETQEDNEDGGEADGEDEENANDNTKEA
ncbi:hypothetical protein BDF22DRAFT_739544 [Syncephalis plumigaleata]|nr:hypothetical protein BDF22DRAFT_739544 [Syncephalis plumigaleata]